jgi:2-C-methyl-D-erythritol 4-phosphate cytidylyltransferase
VPLTDTLKRVAGGQVVATLPRDGLWRAQTPQGARGEVFRRAHAEAAAARARGEGGAEGALATDDVALVERLGLPVEVVPARESNRKITTPEDREWAEWWIAHGGERRT